MICAYIIMGSEMFEIGSCTLFSLMEYFLFARCKCYVSNQYLSSIELPLPKNEIKKVCETLIINTM